MKTSTFLSHHSSATRTTTSLALAMVIALSGTALDASAAPLGVSAITTVAHPTVLRQGDAVIGALPMATPIHIEVALKLRNKDVLDAFIANNAKNQARGLPAQLMTSDQVLANHAPTQAHAQAVADYLTSRSFKNVVIAPNRLLVSADGTALTAGNAFMTAFAQVRTHDGRIAFANTEEVRIPASLSDKVLAVVGLQTVHEGRAVAETASPGAVHTLAIVGHYPTEFQSIYGSFSAVSGGAASIGAPSIGVVTDGNLSQVLTDLDVFATTGRRSVTYAVANTNGVSGDTANVAAWDLASQGAAGMAFDPVALVFYNIPSLSEANLTADYNRAVSANQAKIIEASVIGCETAAQADGSAAAQDAIFQTAVAQGQTFVFPAGNSGADECGDGGQTPSWPASSQYVVAVGGTTLNADMSNWFGETAWSKTGGSASTFEPMPSWQSAFGVPGTTRGVPDVAFDANPASGALIVVHLALTQMGGTGLSAALFAGLWNGMLKAYGTTAGFAGQELYGLPGRDFHDITVGSNGTSAHSGWDYTSGRGSMLVANTLADATNVVNKPPVAGFTLVETGPTTARFIDHSSDPNGNIVSWLWDFGDGTRSHLVNPPHTFPGSGIYAVTETVTDAVGATSKQTQDILVGTIELLKNPGFETGTFSGWAAGSDIAINSDPQFVFAGLYSALFRSNLNGLFSRGALFLPTYKTSPTLTVHLRVNDPANATTVKDSMAINLNVLNSGGGLIGSTRLAQFTNLDASPSFVTLTYDLTPYLGQYVSVTFQGLNRLSAQPTDFYIDDVTITVQ